MDLLIKLGFIQEKSILKELDKAYKSGQPILLLAGGETTVNVKGNGLGGRNQELVLAFSQEASDALFHERYSTTVTT